MSETTMPSSEKQTLNRSTQEQGYRSYVGPPEKYDLVAANQFTLLTLLGLRESHYLLDIGCGSLRAGRLFIPYLLPGRYFGIEPNQWLIDEGIRNEIGTEMIRIKKPVFSNNADFGFSAFGQSFDFLLAQSIFSHAPRNMIAKCLSEARKVMNTDSILVANYFKGENDHAGNEWVYPGCVYYTPEMISRLADENSLECKTLSWPHPNGLTWIAITRSESERTVADFAHP